MTAHPDRLRAEAMLFTALANFDVFGPKFIDRRPRGSWTNRRKIGGNGSPASQARHAKNKSARKARRKNR